MTAIDRPTPDRAAVIIGLSRPLHLALVTDSRPAMIRLESSLRRLEACRIQIVAHPHEAIERADIAQAVLIGFDALANLHTHDPRTHRILSQESRLLAALSRLDLLSLRDILGIADGWVICDSEPKVLYAQIVAALEGHVSVPGDLLEGGGADRIRLSLVAGLTEAEWAVLDLLGQGLENRQIAEQTGDSESTVKSTVRSLLGKLRCRNRTEAAIFAHRQASALLVQRPHAGSGLAS
jgi:DNA-binding NarL/FixJ family response regulator